MCSPALSVKRCAGGVRARRSRIRKGSGRLRSMTQSTDSWFDPKPTALTAGEIWVREELGRLRATRISPRATARFLAASWRRSSATRRARPELARRAYYLLAFGAAAWLAPAAMRAEPFRRRLRFGLAWWGLTAVMLDLHLAMFETEDGRPRPLGAADALTLARAWLVPVVADSPTVLVCGLAAATDALDGRLARRAEPTRAGRDLEALVDACFVLAALRGLTRRRRLARVAALVEAGRLTGGFGYATYAYLGRARAPEARLVGATRSASAVRFAGLIAAAARRRRLGGALLVSASACSIALTARAARG